MNEELFLEQIGLTFDDVLIIPAYSDILPSQVDIGTCLTRKIKLSMPILSAAMDTVTNWKMAAAIAQNGGLGIIHRNQSPEEQAAQVLQVKKTNASDAKSSRDANDRLLVGAAVGVGEDLEKRLELLVPAGVDIICLDTAHGHTSGVLKGIERVKKKYPSLAVIAGNVVTAEGTEALISAGADSIKVGVGAGSICTTRIISGAGMPQITAIHNCAAAAKKYHIPIVADGGVKYSGDIVKAFVAGADCVMLGSLLAGFDESPGEVIEIGEKKYKVYRGMGSLGAMQGYGRDRYGTGQGSGSGKVVPEGVEGRVIYKGNVADFLIQLTGGLRSGMGYAGAHNLTDLKEKTSFVRITNAGLIESHPHSLEWIDDAPNYSAND
jgi:IMP dehydrogenase